MSAELLKYEAGVLKVLDQQKVTQELKYVEVHHAEDAWTVIRQMHAGSENLAAIVGALGLAVDVKRHKDNFKHATQAEKYLLQKLEYLRTAISSQYFSSVIDELRVGVELSAKEEKATPKHVIILFRAAAEKLWASEIDAIDSIGKLGAKKILDITGKVTVRVLTICNTSTLTSAAYGTALSVIRELHRLGALEHVYACETRPLNQDGKLTLREISAFEIVYKRLPASLVTDSAAAYLMAAKHVDCVVVGADRVAANGDMCNELGTYSLAISAMYHKIPFLSAARTTVLDLSSSSFSRPGSTEPAHASPPASPSMESPAAPRRHSSSALDEARQEHNPPAQPLSNGSSQHAALPSSPMSDSALGRRPPLEALLAQQTRSATVIRHPMVDVTPCSLVSGIITEVGVAARRGSNVTLGAAPSAASGGSGSGDGVIDIPAFLRETSEGTLPETVAQPKGSGRPGYAALKEDTIAKHVMGWSAVKSILGTQNARKVEVLEVGDGNLNFVYILKASGGTVVAKQALPYVRCVGESWPLALDRADFEAAALKAQFEVCPFLVPKVLHFDRPKALIVMQYIPPPHKILRKSFIAGERISTFAADVGTFLGRTLFYSSALKLDGAKFRSRVAEWNRNTLCALTEQVVFTDPYHAAPLNRHTSPQLDDFAVAIRSDAPLIRAAAALKSKFISCAQALIHGDLHTGSVMACEGSTFVIDPEFAFYGPMGFDIGAFLANMLLAYFSTPGHAAAGESYGEWLLKQTARFHSTMADTFLELWRDSETSESNGELFAAGPFPRGSEMLEAAREVYMEELWRDTLGFAGAKMIRRIVGIAHVEDLEEIQNADLRSVCEKRSLLLARRMVIASARGTEFADVEELLAAAREYYTMPMEGVSWPTASATGKG